MRLIVRRVAILIGILLIAATAFSLYSTAVHSLVIHSDKVKNYYGWIP